MPRKSSRDRGSYARPEAPVVTEPASRRPQEDRPADLPETRAVIEQATEILMAMYRCGPGEALELLRRASQDGNVKAHVLAATLVDLAKRGLMAIGPEHQET